MPREVAAEVPGLVRNAYGRAHAFVQERFRYDEQRHDALWAVRRGFVEEALYDLGRELAGRYPRRVAVDYGKESGWSHVRLRAGNVLMTQMRMSDPDAKPRPSQYRRRYSGPNLFDKLPLDEQPFPPSDPFYCVLTHSGPTMGRAPNRIEVRFPLPNGEDFFPGSILLSGRDDDASGGTSTGPGPSTPPPELIGDDATPELIGESGVERRAAG